MPALLDPPGAPERRLAAAAAVEGSGTFVADTEALPVAEQLLDGGEIVILAIKPSLWFVLFDAARWVLVGAALLVVAAVPSLRFAGMTSRAAAELAVLLITVRLAIAFLRWVSRFYVLTNRRIMRMRGVFAADLCACPLRAIRSASVSVGPHERATGLGTILIAGEPADADLHWHTIARPAEIHAHIRRAIDRAGGAASTH